MALPWENIGAGLTGIPFPLMGALGGSSGIQGGVRDFNKSDIGRLIDPHKYATAYSPFATDEDKFGAAPQTYEQFLAQQRGLGGGLSPEMQTQLARYDQELAGLGNVDANDPYLQQLMAQARGGAAQQAKLRGLSGPGSVGMSQQAGLTAGLGYTTQENQRRDALRSQLMGQRASALGQAEQLATQRQQAAQQQAFQEWQRQQDLYNQRVAAQSGPLGAIPVVGPTLQAFTTGRQAR